MKKYFDKQFEEMRDDLSDKKRKRDKDKEFSKQSCEMQHEFNEDQPRLVEKALNYLKHDNKKKSKSKLKEVRKNLKKRNKFVKIAKKSPEGWNTVEEYETDNVTWDTANEKGLKKAPWTKPRKKKRDLQRNSSRPLRCPGILSHLLWADIISQDTVEPNRAINASCVEDTAIGDTNVQRKTPEDAPKTKDDI